MPGRITAIATAPPPGVAAEPIRAAAAVAEEPGAVDPLWRVATVDFGGVSQPVSLACLPEARVGDRVLVHVGMALSLVEDDAP